MMRRFGWALRRELWENRWLWLAPLGIAGVLLVGFVVYAARRLPASAAELGAHIATHVHPIALEPYDLVAGVMMGVGLIVAVIYCVDALYGERRDRSVLLWKSLPVSDLETVLAKLAIPLVVLPLIVWTLTVALHLVMLLTSSALLAARGASAAPLWSQVAPLPNALALLYHLVVLHGFALAPIYAWMLLVSAWAPRAPLAFAILPPLAIGVLERVAFGTTRFAELVFGRLNARPGFGGASSGGGLMGALMNPTIGQLLIAPGLWIGFAVAAAFLAGAVRLRRGAQPV